MEFSCRIPRLEMRTPPSSFGRLGRGGDLETLWISHDYHVLPEIGYQNYAYINGVDGSRGDKNEIRPIFTALRLSSDS